MILGETLIIIIRNLAFRFLLTVSQKSIKMKNLEYLWWSTFSIDVCIQSVTLQKVLTLVRLLN